MGRTSPIDLVAGLDADDPVQARHLAAIITHRIREIGRHHLGKDLLDALADLHRTRGDRHLHAFLDAVLARHQDRFRNQPYLALELVELVRTDLAVGADEMSALLMADVVRHEQRDVTALEPRVRSTRIRHALRFVESADPTVDLDEEPEGWFALTVLPVSLVHDEYFFIRALQAHEMVFTTLTDVMQAATRALRRHDVRGATSHLVRAEAGMERAAMLFRTVATMRPADFHAFREYTGGASAIQSESYKRFELTCGMPTLARLSSEAFDNVPGVRAEAPRIDSFTAAWQQVHPQGRDAIELGHAVEALELSHQRWKTTHHSLASAMLGDAHGSGYTEGVPYLRRCLGNRLFGGLRVRRAAA